jgi:hypothetical protein
MRDFFVDFCFKKDYGPIWLKSNKSWKSHIPIITKTRIVELCRFFRYDEIKEQIIGG